MHVHVHMCIFTYLCLFLILLESCLLTGLLEYPLMVTLTVVLRPTRNSSAFSGVSSVGLIPVKFGGKHKAETDI